MKHLDIMVDLNPFEGKQIIECSDDVQTIARHHGLYVNVMDPAFNTSPIDNDANRLNIRTDHEPKIVSFTIG